jgi:hypothetical protein
MTTHSIRLISMKKRQLATYSAQQLVRYNPRFQQTQQAVQGLSNTLVLTIGLGIAMLLSVSHIYLLILIQSS